VSLAVLSRLNADLEPSERLQAMFPLRSRVALEERLVAEGVVDGKEVCGRCGRRIAAFGERALEFHRHVAQCKGLFVSKYDRAEDGEAEAIYFDSERALAQAEAAAEALAKEKERLAKNERRAIEKKKTSRRMRPQLVEASLAPRAKSRPQWADRRREESPRSTRSDLSRERERNGRSRSSSRGSKERSRSSSSSSQSEKSSRNSRRGKSAQRESPSRVGTAKPSRQPQHDANIKRPDGSSQPAQRHPPDDARAGKSTATEGHKTRDKKSQGQPTLSGSPQPKAHHDAFLPSPVTHQEEGRVSRKLEQQNTASQRPSSARATHSAAATTAKTERRPPPPPSSSSSLPAKASNLRDNAVSDVSRALFVDDSAHHPLTADVSANPTNLTLKFLRKSIGDDFLNSLDSKLRALRAREGQLRASRPYGI
jgi:hypothetical protein